MGAGVTAVDHTIKEGFLRRIGADDFIDYTKEDFTVGPRTWDVIFDMVPRGSHAAGIRALNPKGRYLTGNPASRSCSVPCSRRDTRTRRPPSPSPGNHDRSCWR